MDTHKTGALTELAFKIHHLCPSPAVAAAPFTQPARYRRALFSASIATQNSLRRSSVFALRCLISTLSHYISISLPLLIGASFSSATRRAYEHSSATVSFVIVLHPSRVPVSVPQAPLSIHVIFTYQLESSESGTTLSFPFKHDGAWLLRLIDDGKSS